MKIIKYVYLLATAFKCQIQVDIDTGKQRFCLKPVRKIVTFDLNNISMDKTIKRKAGKSRTGLFYLTSSMQGRY